MNAGELQAMLASLDALPKPMPVRPSSFVARGVAYEIDLPDTRVAPTISDAPDCGFRLVYPVVRTLVVNADDYAEAMAALRKGVVS